MTLKGERVARISEGPRVEQNGDRLTESEQQRSQFAFRVVRVDRETSTRIPLQRPRQPGQVYFCVGVRLAGREQEGPENKKIKRKYNIRDVPLSNPFREENENHNT